MWRDFERAYECIPPKAAALMQQIRALDATNQFRINAVVYGALEAGQWLPTEQNWRNWFRQQFRLTFVVQVPPENSYFTLNTALWQPIYNNIDAGNLPDQDECWVLAFPAAQGGAWPTRWP